MQCDFWCVFRLFHVPFFGQRQVLASESADLQMLWQLIKSARDYIASTEKPFPLLRE